MMIRILIILFTLSISGIIHADEQLEEKLKQKFKIYYKIINRYNTEFSPKIDLIDDQINCTDKYYYHKNIIYEFSICSDAINSSNTLYYYEGFGKFSFGDSASIAVSDDGSLFNYILYNWKLNNKLFMNEFKSKTGEYVEISSDRINEIAESMLQIFGDSDAQYKLFNAVKFSDPPEMRISYNIIFEGRVKEFLFEIDICTLDGTILKISNPTKPFRQNTILEDIKYAIMFNKTYNFIFKLICVVLLIIIILIGIFIIKKYYLL